MASDPKKSFILMEHAREENQKKIMEQIAADGVCPFCAENFLKYHTEPIIEETDNWIVTTNFAPYEGTRFHFLFVYKPSHISIPADMTSESRIELFDLVEKLVQQHDLEGGSLFMRFGDGRINGSSVEHLHAQMVVGEMKDDDTEGLRVKLGYKKKS